ncbi:MAG TPA: phosphatidate cytidylyltransferase [Acidimicrobiales bacterium]|nr:phosphatidate cytidylyltransferase [Acidimicrobiales bacterium]
MADFDEDDHQRPTPPRAPGEGVRIIGAQEAAAREAELKGRLPDDMPRYGDVPPQPSGPRPAVRFPLPEDAEARTAVVGATPTATPPDLPHWTEPATGEVPRILAGEDDDDDLEAWSGLTNRQPRWREGSDWEEADFDDDSLLPDEGERMGALDEHREDRDVFTFGGDDDEEIFDDDVAETVPASRGPQTTRIRTRVPAESVEYGNGGGRGGGGSADRDLPVAIAAGVGIGVAALVAFSRGPAWAAAFATIIVLVAAAEAFDVFRRSGFKPATLLGLVATGSLMVGGYIRGERAIPLILALSVMFSMLWYLFGVVRARPALNLGVTLLGLLWVGFLGSFATLMLRYPNREGVAFLLGTVIAVVANDVGALFMGRQFGNTPLAEEISPNKSWEGWAGGLVTSLLICAAIVSRIHPWGFGSAVLLALVASVVGPIGDLCESMIKRDLGLKDMSSVVPGHGGVLDRFDAILFVLPAAYYLVELLNLAGK